MKLFKTADENFEDIGFVKIQDDRERVCYIKHYHDHEHVIEILVLSGSRSHIVRSYYNFDIIDKNNDRHVTAYGMTYYQMKLAMKKMIEKGWVYGYERKHKREYERRYK